MSTVESWRRELAAVTAADRWESVDRPQWTWLVGQAARAGAVAQLLCTPGVLDRGDLVVLHNALVEFGGPAGRRWARLLRAVAGDWTEPVRPEAMWVLAVGWGWPADEVGVLRTWAVAAGSEAGSGEAVDVQWPVRCEVRWAAERALPEHLVIPGTGVPAMKVCTVPLDAGRSLVAVGYGDGSLRLWDPFAWQPVGAPFADDGYAEVTGLCALTATTGRRLLAVADEESAVRLWDADTTTLVAELEFTAEDPYIEILFSMSVADGRTVLVGGDGQHTVNVWDPDTGELAGEPIVSDTRLAGVCAVRLTDGNPVLATADSDGAFQLWDPLAGTPVGSSVHGGGGAGRTDPVSQLAAVPTAAGTLLASGTTHGTVRLWNPAVGDPVGPPPVRHPVQIVRLAPMTAPDGRVLLASVCEGVAQMLDVATGLPAASPLATSVRWSDACVVPRPGGHDVLVVGNDDGMLRLWDPAAEPPPAAPFGHLGGLTAVCQAATAGGRRVVVTGGSDGALQRWDAATGQALGGRVTGHTDGVMALCPVASRDGRVLVASAGSDRTVRLWDPDTGQPVGPPFAGHTDQVRTVCQTRLADGRTVLVSGSADRTVRMWDVATGQPVGRPWRQGPMVRRVHCLPPAADAAPGPVLVVGDDAKVHQWDPGTQQAIAAPIAVPAGVADLCWAGDALIATAGSDGFLRLWDTATGRSIADPLTGPDRRVHALCPVPLPDGRLLLAAGGRHGVTLWDPATRQMLSSMPVPSPVRGLAVHDADLAVATDHDLLMIRLAGSELAAPDRPT